MPDELARTGDAPPNPAQGSPGAGDAGEIVASRDSRDLAAFGYKQELARTLGSFSSFAAGFSYISILTGMFQTFYVGFAAGGPAFFWTWPLVFLGQFLVALCFAELAAHYPLSGSVYQWSKQIGHRAVGWLAGWVYLACLVITIAAVVLALKSPLLEVLGFFGILEKVNYLKDPPTAVLCGCLLILFTTLINAIGVGLLAKINNLGVFSEIFGATLLIILLAFHAQRGPEVVFDPGDHGAGPAGGYLGPFLVAALMASYVMYGYDTAGSLAEETTNPRKKAPWAILQALGAAGLAGALLLLFALMAVDDLGAKELSEEGGGLLYVVRATLGSNLSIVFDGFVLFAITVCALAVHTGTARLMFSMARDNNLPFATTLARVSPQSRTPTVPVLISGLMAAAILMAFANFKKFSDIVIGVAILWANLAYLLVTLSLLWQRFKGWPTRGGSGAGGVFVLGRWGLVINLLAVVWGLFMVVNMAWPRKETYGENWYEQYAAVWMTGVLVGAGGLYYGLVQRHKTGVLREHRVTANNFSPPTRSAT
jgi:urea carboxylase system permease